ncbi:MAG TPA: PIN domain-containing protein, partial [Allocoleopsis sp.]
MKLLLDADVLLEALLNRQFYGDQTSLIWNILENNLVEAYITNMGLNHIEGFFSHCHQEVVDSIHRKLCEITYIYQVTDDLIEKTRLSPLLDFESALEIEVAQELKVDAIITHYPQNFQNHHYQDQQISILSLEDLHQIIQLEKSLDVDLYSNKISLPDQIFSPE